MLPGLPPEDAIQAQQDCPEHQPILGQDHPPATVLAAFPPPSGHRSPSSLSTPSVPLPVMPALARRWLRIELNFYRCHLLGFTLIPFVFAVLFYSAHTLAATHSPSQRPNFVDCLFMCYSAMTMTGLNTLLVGSLNRLQQVLLYILMAIGSTTMVSIIMICIRLRAFKTRFRAIHPPSFAAPFPRPATPRPPPDTPLSRCPPPNTLSISPFVPPSLPDGSHGLAELSHGPHLAQSSSQPFLNHHHASPNHHALGPTNSSQRAPSKLVRRNSDGGVVPISTTQDVPFHSSANLIPPSPSILQSSRPLALSQRLKSPLLFPSLDFQKSAARISALAHRSDKFLPRASTFDVPDHARSLKQVCDMRLRPVWRSKDGRSLFGLARTRPSRLGRHASMVSSSQTVVNRTSLENAIQLVAQDSILQTASSRPDAQALGQVGFADLPAQAAPDDPLGEDNLGLRPTTRSDSQALAVNQLKRAEGADAIHIADDANEGPRIRRPHARNPSGLLSR